jgi:hypothetical protein
MSGRCTGTGGYDGRHKYINVGLIRDTRMDTADRARRVVDTPRLVFRRVNRAYNKYIRLQPRGPGEVAVFNED